jgi:hypothetical protein
MISVHVPVQAVYGSVRFITQLTIVLYLSMNCVVMALEALVRLKRFLTKGTRYPFPKMNAIYVLHQVALSCKILLTIFPSTRDPFPKMNAIYVILQTD